LISGRSDRAYEVAEGLLAVLSEDPADPRNPPGTGVRQAEHLLALLA
jgi:hypothetical protein